MLTNAATRPPSTRVCVSWRNLRGPADYRVLADIGRRCNLADHVDEVPTVASIANEMEHPVNFDPSEDLLIGEIHGRPVAWQKTSWRLEGSGRYIYMLAGFVSPGWRRRGIGRELVRRGERRLRQVAASHPAGAEHHFSTFSPASREGKLALFESEGYQPIRHFYTMLRASLGDLPAAPMPAGLELRAVRPEHLRLIWDANEEAFRDHWRPMVLTDEDFNRWQQQPDFDPSLWQVAWDAATDQVAGVSVNVIPRAANAAHNRQRGVVDNLSVRRPWRKRGLGRALLVASLRALREHGLTEVALGVDAENLTGALRLYEGVGFRLIEHGMVLSKICHQNA
jgi:mycothiol synthase